MNECVQLTPIPAHLFSTNVLDRMAASIRMNEDQAEARRKWFEREQDEFLSWAEVKDKNWGWAPIGGCPTQFVVFFSPRIADSKLVDSFISTLSDAAAYGDTGATVLGAALSKRARWILPTSSKGGKIDYARVLRQMIIPLTVLLMVLVITVLVL